MVASKISFVVAAIALNAASSYAAPASYTENTLNKREVDDGLFTRSLGDLDLYARNFYYDDLQGREIEGEMEFEARNSNDDNLYARDLDGHLSARAWVADEKSCKGVWNHIKNFWRGSRRKGCKDFRAGKTSAPLATDSALAAGPAPTSGSVPAVPADDGSGTGSAPGGSAPGGGMPGAGGPLTARWLGLGLD